MNVPTGMKIAVNRLNKPYRHLFDGREYVLAPQEQVLLPQEVAEFLRDTSMVKMDPHGGEHLFAVALEGEPGFTEMVDEDLGDELLDRSKGDYMVKGDSQSGELVTMSIKDLNKERMKKGRSPEPV